jgi:tetratricopeptide (TPR) repeat protein
MTIYGLGGCGKSALALESAYRALARHARRLVFWVPAMSQESFDLAFREIGTRLRIPGVGEDGVNVKQLVKQALCTSCSEDWLMIVDNADDVGILLEPDSSAKSTRLIDYIPHSDAGSVLFTTRSRKAATELTQTHILGLDDMGQTEARQLLARRISREVLLDDRAAVDELLELLTGLPLAIVQATAFINENDVSISDYVLMLQHAGTKAELFSERFTDSSRYQGMDSTVAKTWHTSFQQIQRQDPLAAEYLSFISCIDRINIPQSLLPPGTSQLQHIKALGTLTGYAFLTERQQTVPGSNKERFFDMHRLVHMALSWWMEAHGQRKAWAGTAAARVEELVPFGGHERREIWIAYLPHALHVVGLEDALDSATSAGILERIGRCQRSNGQYVPAELAHRQAWSLRKGLLGQEHPDTLDSVNHLGLVLSMQGKYKEAEVMHQQALEGREKVLGQEHPDTLASVNNLGSVLEGQGKYKEAEVMYQQALEGSKKVLGQKHPNTLTGLNNLGLVLSMQGKYKEAEVMHQQALEGREKVLGQEHPDTLASVNNLGLVLEGQGKYKEAEVMYQQAREGYKKVLGQKHPNTLTSMNNLGFVLLSQGLCKEAEVIHRQALEGCKKVLGPANPLTLASVYNLGLVLERQGKYEEAEAIQRLALEGCERVFGQEHHKTLKCVYSLAHLLAQRHRISESLLLYQRACAGHSVTLGNNHPTTRACYQHYSELCKSKGQRRFAFLPASTRDIAMSTQKESRLSRGLVRLGIRRKHSK